jgi:orotate phosphoribosyltransferase
MSTKDNLRARLRAIIRERSYLTGGDFQLASGAESSFFFDMKPTLLDPEGATLVAELILDRIAPYRVTAIGGLELGACPIASAVCVRSWERPQCVAAFYVRKTPKKRGTQKMIEGAELQPGARVAMVDDVTTSGGSTLQAVEEVRKLGCTVACVLSVVDRQQGARERFAAESIPFEALFTRDDFTA